ncbi:hypothetical protein R5R35_012004 [Gryllus longicercus]|uniref:Uncharacterized protein n=1 Tax=Gryllus longicercus TaxID=2509291 RepID=A0AAN9WAW4_9ORTH
MPLLLSSSFPISLSPFFSLFLSSVAYSSPLFFSPSLHLFSRSPSHPALLLLSPHLLLLPLLFSFSSSLFLHLCPSFQASTCLFFTSSPSLITSLRLSPAPTPLLPAPSSPPRPTLCRTTRLHQRHSSSPLAASAQQTTQPPSRPLVAATAAAWRAPVAHSLVKEPAALPSAFSFNLPGENEFT